MKPLAATLVASLIFVGDARLPVNAAATVPSHDDRVAALEEKLDRSLKLIEQLTARVQELEAERAPGTAATDSQLLPRLDNIEQQITQMADADATRHSDDAGVPVHGFADVDVGTHNATDRTLKGFGVGSLDLFMNPTLGDKTRALFELNFEVGDDGAISAEVERAQLGYLFNDNATLWLGRFHTPFGYYNTAFHHGQQIATSLRRPRFLEFEDRGGILPSHTVGAWLTGMRRVDEAKLTYDFFVGNGQTLTDGSLQPRNGGVDRGGAMFGANLGYAFGETWGGLKIGVSAFRLRASDDQLAGRITRVDNASLYFVYDTDRFEHIGEFYRFNNTDMTVGGPAHRSYAGYLQLGWRLATLMPYARFERAALDQSDPYFALQRGGMSYRRAALGLRFDLDMTSALKLELARTRNTDRLIEQWDEVLLQYAVRF